MLKIENLNKSFGQNQAVKDLSLEIKKGEIFSLIGPNGSGKTTIIKSIMGILRPDEGVVKVGGKNVLENPKETKKITGYIPDDPAIWPEITGEEFLFLTGRLYDIDNKEIKKEVPRLLDIFALDGIEKEYFENYSRGNKQKFAILAAFLIKPKLLLIDEPIVGLDPESAEIAKKKFQEFANNGGAILMATHTLTVAKEISHKIGVLKKGVLEDAASFKKLAEKADLKQDADLEDVYMALT
ncbi:MAG: ABC transporter ATP-binding protein [Candidatus Moraniibacteriota bacterium]